MSFQDAASIASVLNVAVLGVGYYFLIKLYREWANGNNIIYWEQIDSIEEEAIRLKGKESEALSRTQTTV